jgi:hypothetical protein
MATMECKAFLAQLDSWMEGVRPSEARAHVASCRDCRSLAEDLTAIASTAGSMAADAPEPPAYLWNSIRAQLEQEGVIRQPHTAVSAECKAFADQLDSWMGGVRRSEARAHVASCRGCRSLAEDFAAIAATAQTMAEEAPEPPAYLWNSIRAQLEREGLIRHPHTAVSAECKAFADQLASWMEGVRPSEACSHVALCRDCRALAEDLTAITSAASSMDADAPEPPAYLWNSIRARLTQEGIIREPRAVPVVAPAKAWHGWFRLPRPAFAGAFAMVLVVAGLAARGPLTRRINDYRWMQGTQQSTAPITAQLNTVEHATVASLRSDPLVEAALHKNLAIVDNYIALCEKSVRENPQSEMARDFLYDAYQQKADLLAQMNDQGMNDQGE